MGGEPKRPGQEPRTRAAPYDLGLGDLITHVMHRAQDAGVDRERLRDLVRATQVVVGDLSLDTVLERVVRAACELVDAPYGALGVVDAAGRGLEAFVQVGFAPATVEAIGPLPEGRGLLGALAREGRPIRLRDLTGDPRSGGLPPHHPPVRGFLGVPVRVGEQVFGHLYLACGDERDFTAEDEELVTALATAAGVAVENARTFEEARRRQEWLSASTDVTRQLLATPGEDALRLVARHVADLAEADVVTVVSPRGSMVEIDVAVGRGAERLCGARYPVEGTLSQRVLETGEPHVIDDATVITPGEPRLVIGEVVAVGPVMVLPLASDQGVRGVLMAGRAPDGRRFTDADVDMATTFAHHASVALELVAARRQSERMELFEERSRIARDLHDHVIQQLFGAGMTLQGVAAAIPDSPSVEVVEQVVDTLDDAIRQIRASIFQLRPRALLGTGLRASVLAVVKEVTASLGHDPQVHFVGPVDSVSSDELVEQVVAVVREGLVNVARHAFARRSSVTVRASRNELVITVEDDGRGTDASDRRSGLENLRQRAECRGGTFEVGPGPGGSAGPGTQFRWRVPVG